jgi:hypothetical protein
VDSFRRKSAKVNLRAGCSIVGWATLFFSLKQAPLVDCQSGSAATLMDAGDYITELPKAEHSMAEWQAAMEALMLIATLGGPTMFARIGVMRALNRHVERVFDPSRKDKHRGRRKLARGIDDQSRQLSRLPIILEGEARLQAMPQSMAASADQSDRIPSTETRPALYREPAAPAP